VDSFAKSTARVRYSLTPVGHERLLDAFVGFTGERRKFGSIGELDPRTVARIYYNIEPFDLSSLMVLFRALKLDLRPSDYGRAARLSAANRDEPADAGRPRREQAASVSFGEPDGGAVPLGSRFYVEREADRKMKAAIRRRENTILVKGPRHSGKSSLLARALHEAQSAGCRTAWTDCDALDGDRLGSKEKLCKGLAASLARQLDMPAPDDQWQPEATAVENLHACVRRALGQSEAQLLWAMDGVDALIGCGYHQEIFAMLRGWHNARSGDPAGHWERLTLVLSYAAEASLMIASDKLSPFNVGVHIPVGDLTPAELSELNRRHGCPLASANEEQRLYALLGGHPFLIQSALFEIKDGRSTLAGIERAATLDGGIFIPNLGEIRDALREDTCYRALVSAIAANRRVAPDPETNRCFHRLRSAGILKGESVDSAALRCELFRLHFTKYPL
jgi:hypothetical protein